MKRLTCDNPQDNFLTMMNYVFPKDGWAHIRHDGENEDVPLTDWAKAQCAKCEFEISVGDTPEEIDETLCECLMGGEGCPVALAYCFACQAAGLRDRLKAIEDILGEEYDLDQVRQTIATGTAPEGDGWLPVSEKPTENGFYLVWTRNAGFTRGVWSELHKRWMGGAWTQHITHWMPHVKPPKEVQEWKD